MSNFDMTDNAGPCDPTSDPSTLGQPIEVASREAIPFRHVRNIGQGGSAVIEMVSHTFTNQIFALKTFRRYNRRQFESVKRVFINEISIMRRLSSHPHIIQLRGSYICDRELGILLSPVAGGGDLAAYITRALESGMPSEQEITLNRAFGCLAGGLAFIHKHTIRHKDIKPQNILVHEGRVLYTDFGISFDADQQDTTTVGCPGIFTQRYCAPEVQDWANRNRKSDVYSLGCVYLEILDALEPEVGFRQMDDRPYFAKLKQVRQLLSQASVTGGVRKGLFSVCHDMLDPDQVKRLDTNNVVCRMTKLSNPPYHSDTRLYCNDCLRKVECNNPECNDEDKSKDKETWKEKEGDFAAKSVDAGLTVDGRYSDKEMYSDAGVSSDKGTPLDTGSQEISIDVVNNGKKKKRVTKKSKIWDSGENAGPWHGAKKFPKVSTNNSRFYCTICGELGHTTLKCPNDCWACGELYHKSDECPNRCWTCDEVGHHAKDCPNKCDACGDIGHSTDDCPDACWTCGELGHFASDCEDECFVCGRLGHATQECNGKCHKCGKIGHWRRDCHNACFHCGELGHWAAQCPSKPRRGPKDKCFKCEKFGHWASQCPQKQQGWRPILNQVPQGAFKVKSSRRK